MDRNYDVITFTSKYFILSRPVVANFADFIEIVIILIKTIFKYSIKIKRIRNYL